MKRVFLFMVICLIAVRADAGKIWLGAGLGGGSEGMAATFNFSGQVDNKWLFGMRFVRMSELSRVNENSGWFGGEEFSPSVSDGGILFGRILNDNTDSMIIALSIGVGTVNIVEKGEWVDSWLFKDHWGKISSTTAGFLFQGEFEFKKITVLGFADFNSIKSFGGISLSYKLFTSKR